MEPAVKFQFVLHHVKMVVIVHHRVSVHASMVGVEPTVKQVIKSLWNESQTFLD